MIAALLASWLAVAGAKPPAWDEVVAIPAELLAQLDAQVVQKANSPEHRLHLLVDFMFDADGLGLEYDTALTGTVEQTWRSGKGNCLSFTLTFVALAREAGMRAYVQELDHALALFRGEDMVFRSGHVNAVVKVQGRRNTVDFDREVLLTAGNPRRISNQRIAAHFYNNRGAELLADGDFAAAAEHFDAAIAADPRFVATWNNIGVMHSRQGDPAGAEQAFREALRRDSRHMASLSNLVGLYTLQERRDLLEPLQARLTLLQRGDPVYNFMLGLRHEHRGEYADAILAYQRAVQLQKVEPRFHLGLARAYLRSGDAGAAERAIDRAMALSGNEARRVLQAKLQAIRR